MTDNARPIDLSARLALRASEAAKVLGIGERSLRTLTNDGKIPHCRLGGSIVYPVDALREFLRQAAETKPLDGEN